MHAHRKDTGDPCTTSLFTAPICSTWGSLFSTEGTCDDYPVSCRVEIVECAADDSRLTCRKDDQNGDAIMIGRSTCEYRENEEAACVRREPEVAQVCNDQIGDRVCHDVTEADESDILYEVTAMKCVEGEEMPECVPKEVTRVADCSETDQYCAIETQEGTIETLSHASHIEWYDTLPGEFIIDYEKSWRAACEDRPPCLDKSYGDACETGIPAHCDDNMLVLSAGTCDTMELAMFYECFPTRVDCGDLQCVESDDSASCQ